MAKKKGIGILIAGLDKEPGGGEESGKPDKEKAAQRLIDGVKAGSAKKVALAFAELYEICAMSSDEEETEDEEDDLEDDEESDY